MKTLFTPLRSLLVVCLIAGLGLQACKQADSTRPATTRDIYGTWTSDGLAFESGGPAPTAAQLTVFNHLKAASYTFNLDNTYLKRSLDSSLSATKVVTTLETGTFKLADGLLTLTTQDGLTKTSRNQYYLCHLSTTALVGLGSYVEQRLSLQITKELLLKALDESAQPSALEQQTRDFLAARTLFQIDQILHP